MASTGNITIHIEPGEIRQRWCDICQTSAGYDVDLYMLWRDAPRYLKTISGCERCDDALEA